MAKLKIVIQHKRMPTSAMSSLDQKCLEQLYYSLLFSTPAYSNKPNKYFQWLNMGFDVAVKEQPREAKPADKLLFNTASLGNKMEIVVVNGNDEILSSLLQLIMAIDAMRTKIMDTAVRIDTCLALPILKDGLLKPMTDSMNKDGLRPNEKGRFLDKVREAVAVLSEDNVSHLQASTPAAAS